MLGKKTIRLTLADSVIAGEDEYFPLPGPSGSFCPRKYNNCRAQARPGGRGPGLWGLGAALGLRFTLRMTTVQASGPISRGNK